MGWQDATLVKDDDTKSDQPKGWRSAVPVEQQPAAEQPSLFSKVIGNTARLAKGAMDINTNEYGADVLRGVGLTGTGIGEMIPGLHGPAAAESKELEGQIKHPTAKWIGETLPFLAGGEWLGAGKAASLVPEVAEGAEGALAGMGRAFSSMGRGAAGGAVIAGETGLAAPTGEQDVHEMARQKARMGLQGVAGGAVLGGAVGAFSGIAGEIPGALDIARGKSLNAAMERLTRKGGEGAEAALGEESAKSEAALRQASEIEPRLHQETEKLDAAKGGSGDAEANADRLVKEFQAKPTMSGVEFGGRVRQVANDTYERLENERATQSGYTDAINEAKKKGAIVKTDKLLDYLKAWRKTTNDPNAESVINYVQNRIAEGGKESSGLQRSYDEAAGVEATEAKAANQTIDKMDSMRKVLNRLYRTQDMRAIGGDGSAATSAHEISGLNKLLREAIESADPRVAEAAGKYRELSRPLDPFERKGPLAGIVKTDELSDEYIGEVGKLLNAVLSKTEGGAATEGGEGPLALLVREDPSLKDAARKYFQSDLFGEKGLERDVTPKQFTKWLTDNKRALEQTGLTGEFTAMRNKIAGAANSVDKMAVELAARQGNVKAIQKALDEASDAGKLPAASADRYRTLLSKLEATKNLHPDEQTVDLSRKALTGIFDQLNADKKITPEEYTDALTQINSLSAKKLSHHKMVTLFTRAALTATLLAGGWRLFHVGQLFTGL